MAENFQKISPESTEGQRRKVLSFVNVMEVSPKSFIFSLKETGLNLKK